LYSKKGRAASGVGISQTGTLAISPTPFGEGLGVSQLRSSFPPELFKVLPQFSGGNH